MDRKRKTILASVVAVLVGSSCCWISVAMTYLGGVAFAGAIAVIADSLWVPAVAVGVIVLGVWIWRRSSGVKR